MRRLSKPLAAFLLGGITILCLNAAAIEEQSPDFEETTAPEWTPPPLAPAPTDAPPAAPASGQEAPAYIKELQAIWDDSQTSDQNTAGATDAPASSFGLRQTIQTVAGLFLVCGIIILGGYIMRRYGKGTPLLAGQRLGKVIGHVHLSPRASLHYIKSGGRVLVVGVTQQTVSPVAEYDVEEFESFVEAEEAGTPAENPAGFLTQLRDNMGKAPGSAAANDEELASLRGDIQRLQQFLQESAQDVQE